jgi:plastocyanin
MTGKKKWFAASVAAAATVGIGAGPAQPAEQKPAREVSAEGDVFIPGSLAFNPVRTAVRVGQIVRWTNTDPVVPHTATEDHGLWNLTGTYGQTPVSPAGFGPGEQRSRAFEAGTQHYYCKVHPTQMRGVVAVPVFLSRSVRKSGGKTHYLILAQWAAKAPAAGEAFDVEVKRANGAWKRVRTATRATSMRFDGGKVDTLWAVRARLRKANDASAATDWSPTITIRA